MAAITPSGPGKTAPKILKDFLEFDPQKSIHGNLLTDQPPHIGAGQSPERATGACRHEYVAKLNQSVTPSLDSIADSTTRYKLAVVCKKCRIHVDVHIDHSQASKPCPTADCPLHHFIYVPERHTVDQTHISYGWQCSSASCRAILDITFRLASITKEDVLLLTDTSKLKRRYEEVMADEPEREGIRQATPVEALSRLRKYIKDSLKPEHEKRRFPANNKRFMEAFGLYGRDCSQLLQRLGFREDVRSSRDAHAVFAADASQQQQELTWDLPDPELVNDRLQSDGTSLREVLEDVEYELLALLAITANETRAVNPCAAEGLRVADRDLERVLATQGYPRLSSLSRQTSNTPDRNPHTASLGAVSDFGDSLIEFAYQRQSDCDPVNTPYYFECFQEITNQRNSEELQLKMVMLQSSGLVSRRDLVEAYRAFDLPSNGGGADDDRIMNLFQSQISDQGQMGQERLREMLGRIGRFRGSTYLINASQQSIQNVEDAYAWLGNGLNAQSPDDMVTTIYAVRTEGSKDLEVTGKKAISMIAKERKSNYLNSWLIGEDPNEASMDIGEALRLLNVDQALTDVEPTLWMTIFENARQGRAGSQTERAIVAVEAALRGASTGCGGKSHSPETWPVGLISHGNTCYLNSLLQYYFSLKPLRDIVLNYDQYKVDTATMLEKRERVGQLMVSQKEIEGGQKFAEELRHLFERMIKDPGPAVKPEQDLVCRAFLAPSDSALLGGRQAGPENAIDDSNMAATNLETTAPLVTEPEAVHSSASSATLQASVDGDSDTAMQGIEAPPTPPASPGLNAKQPENPPPLPPRRFSTTTSDTLRLAEEKARQQQDVTEVHDSITQRLRAGMKPQGADHRGEQRDPLRDLFSIGLSQTSLPADGKSKTEEIADSSILLQVPQEPTDLYSALDAYFDPADVSEGSAQQQYKTLTEMPPLVQISMPRIFFNKVTKATEKSTQTMRLEDELYLDRYFDASHPDVPERRRKAWGWRKRLCELKTEQRSYGETTMGLSGPSAVTQTAKYIQSLEDVNKDLVAMGEDPIETDSELHLALTADASFQTERLNVLETEAIELQDKLKTLFADLKDVKYRLHAVFFHRGSNSGGHYWVSIHDFQNDVWRSYNDENVNEVPTSQLDEIFHANDWRHGTPTYAVYVRDDMKDACVQAVCRAPEKVPTPRPASPAELAEIGDGWQDVAMTDGNSSFQNRTVDPANLIKEGGANAWDAERAVADSQWSTPRSLLPFAPTLSPALPSIAHNEENMLAALSLLLGKHIEAGDVDWTNFDAEIVQMQLEMLEKEARTGGKRVKLPGVGFLNLLPPK